MGILIFLLSTATAAASVAPTTAAADDQGALPPALVSLQSCVRDRGRLSVLFMIDESKSLSDGARATDPNDERVPGMKAALSGLRRLAADGTGTPAHIEVAFSGFSTDARKVSGWQDLNGSSLSSLEHVAQGFATRDQGRGTDYEAALRLASDQLLERAGSVSGTKGSCSALIFFTDGKYQRADKDLAAQQQGKQTMCRPGGLADQLRRAGVTTIVVSLSHFDAASSDFLQGLADGSSEQPCGREGAPETGVYIPVEHAEDLFFRLGFPGGAPKEGDHVSFDTVEGLHDFLVRAAIPPQGVLTIQAPGQQPRVLKRGTSATIDLAGTQLDVHWTTRSLVEMSGTFDPKDDAWQGAWIVGFGARSRYTAFLTTSFDLALQSPRIYRLESPAQVVVQLRESGRPAAGPLVDRATVRASVKLPGARSGQAVALRRTGTSRWTGDYTPPDTSASQLQTSMRATFPPRGDADVLPVERIDRRDTAPPIEYPDVRPHVLSLGTLRGRENESITTETQLQVVGSSVADGCVWLTGSGIDAPGGVDSTISADGFGTSRGSCLPIGRDQKRSVPVRLTVDHIEDGTVQADLKLAMYSEKTRATRMLDVPVQVRLGRERNPWVLVEVLLLSTVMGLVIPALVLHIINRFTGKLSPAHRTRMHMTQVVVERDRVTTIDGRDLFFPLDSYYETFRLLNNQTSSASRELRVPPIVVRALASGSWRRHRWAPTLLRGPMAIASTPARDRLYAGSIRSRRPLRSLDSGRIQEVPMALGGTWIFLPDPIGTDSTAADELRFRRPGRLWIFTSGTGGLDQPADVVGNLNDILPGKLVMSPGDSSVADGDGGGRLRSWIASRRGASPGPSPQRPRVDPDDPFVPRPGATTSATKSTAEPPPDRIDGW